ncbi:MAG: hypothetical protein HZB16_10800 [Armatimonadetes bacterium]|nr:hypothetical protein [Armatimonadota bacterium]
MRPCKLLWLLAAALPALAGEQYATWDKLFLKPQVPMVAIAPEGTVTLLAYHQYPAAMHNLRAAATSEQLTLTVRAVPMSDKTLVGRDPATLAEMPPTEIHSFELHAVRRAGAAAADVAKVTVTFTADELREPLAWDMVVPLNKAGEKQANDPLTMPAGEVQVVVVRSSKAVFAYQVALCLLLLAWWWRRKAMIGSRVVREKPARREPASRR